MYLVSCNLSFFRSATYSSFFSSDACVQQGEADDTPQQKPQEATTSVVVTEAHPVETATTKKIIGSFNMEVTEPHPVETAPTKIIGSVNMEVTEPTHPVEEEGGEWHDSTNPESNEMTSKH